MVRRGRSRGVRSGGWPPDGFRKRAPWVERESGVCSRFERGGLYRRPRGRFDLPLRLSHGQRTPRREGQRPCEHALRRRDRTELGVPSPPRRPQWRPPVRPEPEAPGHGRTSVCDLDFDWLWRVSPHGQPFAGEESLDVLPTVVPSRSAAAAARRRAVDGRPVGDGCGVASVHRRVGFREAIGENLLGQGRADLGPRSVVGRRRNRPHGRLLVAGGRR